MLLRSDALLFPDHCTFINQARSSLSVPRCGDLRVMLPPRRRWACINIQSVSTQEAQGRGQWPCCPSPSQLSPAAKRVNGCKRPWICNNDHRGGGLLDTFGIEFSRPNALQIKFPERAQLSFPEPPLTVAAKGLPCVCALFSLMKGRGRGWSSAPSLLQMTSATADASWIL